MARFTYQEMDKLLKAMVAEVRLQKCNRTSEDVYIFSLGEEDKQWIVGEFRGSEHKGYELIVYENN